MEKAELKIDYTVCRESYPEGFEELCRAALDVTKNAYCVDRKSTRLNSSHSS